MDISKKARVEKIIEGIKNDLERIETSIEKLKGEIVTIKRELTYLNNIMKGGYD